MLEQEWGKPYPELTRRGPEFGGNFWQNVVYWPEGTREIYAFIYRDDYRHLPPVATVRVRDGNLPRRIAEEERRHYQIPPLNPSPGTDAAFEARRVTARLRLGIDTGQRAFSCPYP